MAIKSDQSNWVCGVNMEKILANSADHYETAHLHCSQTLTSKEVIEGVYNIMYAHHSNIYFHSICYLDAVMYNNNCFFYKTL